MCGILGWYKFNNKPFSDIERDRFQKGLDSIAHRGPDADQINLIKESLLFGHRRLSIIDLAETNNQPFKSLDGNYTLIYNGEIFNFKELREHLISNGYEFVTTGDTEVLIYAYDYWGEDCVNHFNGMWAFALYDKKEDKLFCSRDRFGIKPFNYNFSDQSFVFCSEVKGILNIYPQKFRPNYKVIGNFLRKTVGGQLQETWFDGIERLMPAHNMIIKGRDIKTYRYWQYPLKVNRKIKEEEAKKEYLYLLTDAVKLRMRSDVPVGTTLSSGLDSTSLVALMRKVYDGEHNTYTAYSEQTSFHKLENTRFKNDVNKDESELIRRFTLPLNLKTNFVKTNHEDYFEVVEKLLYYLEAPHHSQSIVPLFQLLQRAKKNVTVLLEGQGADELLGGYISKNAFAASAEMFKNLKLGGAYKNLKYFSKYYNLNQAFQLYIRSLDIESTQRYFQARSAYSKLYIGEIGDVEMIKDSPIENPGFDESFNSYLHKQHTGTLVDLLHYGDRISMANSIESRLPFMDYRLVEFAFQLPVQFKVNEGKGKIIHRQAMKDVLPGFINDNPYKFGFSTPISKIYMDKSKNSLSEMLCNGELVNRDLIDPDIIKRVVLQHQSEERNHSRVLYRLSGAEAWIRKFDM